VVLRLFRRLALRLALAGRTLRRSDRDDKSLDQKATVKVTTKGRKVGIDCAQVDINNNSPPFRRSGLCLQQRRFWVEAVAPRQMFLRFWGATSSTVTTRDVFRDVPEINDTVTNLGREIV